jgi:hypothetical protein
MASCNPRRVSLLDDSSKNIAISPSLFAAAPSAMRLELS